jgi:hypothetical protein
MKSRNPAAAAVSVALFAALLITSELTRAGDGPPALELHLWGGSDAASSSSLDLRSAEAAIWATRKDRFAVRYDNSLSLDNPALARAGVDAQAYSVSYLHDFSGNYLVSGDVGKRSLAGGISQDIYKMEFVRLRDGRAAKLGVQVSPTKSPGGDYTDTVVFGALNFPLSPKWRLEPAVYAARSGLLRGEEWRLAGYSEYNASNGTQIGFGGGLGRVRSSETALSGSVISMHARLSWPIYGEHLVHLQIRHESSPQDDYTLGLVGFSLRFPRQW